ncbi:hypothetical protein PIROE2DRAFT_9782 [Piromyces sp. E2]|nr:hypothetical protein PIROE2DRAFT_9782 [Piromyces sp. E2]|eukprot:OUM63639.1 hypothetical protein PIROE2DRAFT_9782 [Piromyces sp. E2]
MNFINDNLLENNNGYFSIINTKSEKMEHYFKHENYTIKEEDNNYLEHLKEIRCGDDITEEAYA